MLSPYHSVAFFIHSSFFRHKSCISHRPHSQSPWFWKQLLDHSKSLTLALGITWPLGNMQYWHLPVEVPMNTWAWRTRELSWIMISDDKYEETFWDYKTFWSDEQPMSQSHIGHLRLLCRVTVQEELCSVLWLQRLQFQVVCLHPAEGVLDLEPRRKALQLSKLE